MPADPSSLSAALMSLPVSYQAAAAIGVFVGGVVLAMRGYTKPAVTPAPAALVDAAQVRLLIDAITRLPQLLQEVKDAVDRAGENAGRANRSVSQFKRAVRDLHDTLKPR